MKKITKVFMFAALSAVILVAGLIIALYSLPAGDLVRRNVEERIEKASGRSVRVEGLRVGFSASSLVGIYVKGLRVFGETGEELLMADEIVLRPQLLPLIRGRVVIGAAAVNGFRCRIVHRTDGAIIHPFIGPPRKQEDQPRPASHQEPATGDTQFAASHDAAADGQGALDWSVVETSISHGTVTWRDEAHSRQVEWSLQEIAGRVSQKGDLPEFSFSLEGQAGSRERDNRLTVEGNVKFRGGFTGTERVKMTLIAKRPNVESLRAYLSGAAEVLNPVTVEQFKASVDTSDGAAPAPQFEVNLRVKDDPGAASLAGTCALSPDFSEVRSVRCRADLQAVSPALAGAILPAHGFLDFSSARVDGRVEGDWKKTEDWTAHGGLTVHGVGVVGQPKQIPNVVSLQIEAEANSREVHIKKLETLEPAGLCAVAGRITNLTSDAALDLTAHVSLPTSFLAAFGTPAYVQLSGATSFPVELRFRGPLDRVDTRLSANFKNIGASSPPYFEKPAGAKCLAIAEGVLSTGLDRVPTGAASLTLGGSMEISGAKARAGAGGKWLSPLSVLLRASLIHHDGKTRVKEATLRVAETGREIVVRKRPTQGKGAHGKQAEGALTEKEILKARVSPLAGASAEALELVGDLRVDRAVLEACVPEHNALSSLKGSTVISAHFKGTPQRGSWRINTPLEGLDVSMGASFRKPAGVKGGLTASGAFHSNSFRLEKADLSLPGLSVSATDVVVDDKGLPREVKFALPRTKLEGLDRYVPALKGAGIHGGIEGRAVLSDLSSNTQLAGALILKESSWRPVDARWGFDAVAGEIAFKNDSIRVESMAGRLAGALQGPLKLSASLTNLANPAKLSGSVALDAGKGAVKTELVSYFLNRAGIPSEKLFAVLKGPQAKDFLPYDYVKGDFVAEEGIIRTENLRLRGKDIRIGAIGGLRLPGGDIDALLGLRTVLHTGEVLAAIPGLQEILKKNRGLIKATGIERELERIGVKLPGNGEPASGGEDANTPITLILSFKGPVSNPRVKPELESVLEKGKASRMKTLIE